MYRKLKKGEAALNRVYGWYKQRAERKGLEFTISIEDFEKITKKRCHYCKTEPNLVVGDWKNWKPPRYCKGSYTYNGVDRKDNSIGYIKNNILPCCTICNRAKNTLSYKEFINWIKSIRRIPK